MNPISNKMLALSVRLSDLSNKIMRDPRTKNALGFAMIGVLAAVVFSMAQPTDRTGTLTAPLPIPMMMDGKQVGKTTAPTGTKVQILQEDEGKFLVATLAGRAWTESVTTTPVPPEPEKPENEKFRNLPTGKEFTPSSNTALEAEVLELTNAERARFNLPPLTWNESLAEAARYHAADMAADQYFSHDSKDRTNGFLRTVGKPFERIHRFDPSGCAENIAYNQPSPRKTMSDWMNSLHHRTNILSKDVRTLGVGYVLGYIVQDFGN